MQCTVPCASKPLVQQMQCCNLVSQMQQYEALGTVDGAPHIWSHACTIAYSRELLGSSRAAACRAKCHTLITHSSAILSSV